MARAVERAGDKRVTVDRMADRLPHADIRDLLAVHVEAHKRLKLLRLLIDAERAARIVHDVHSVDIVALEQNVDTAGLQFHQSDGHLGNDAEGHVLDDCLFAPVVVIALQHNTVVGRPRYELIGARSDAAAQKQLRVILVGLAIALAVDADELQIVRPCDVIILHRNIHGIFVDGLCSAEVDPRIYAGLTAVRGQRGIGIYDIVRRHLFAVVEINVLTEMECHAHAVLVRFPALGKQRIDHALVAVVFLCQRLHDHMLHGILRVLIGILTCETGVRIAKQADHDGILCGLVRRSGRLRAGIVRRGGLRLGFCRILLWVLRAAGAEQHHKHKQQRKERCQSLLHVFTSSFIYSHGPSRTRPQKPRFCTKLFFSGKLVDLLAQAALHKMARPNLP